MHLLVFRLLAAILVYPNVALEALVRHDPPPAEL
jgi:hypothetical protein